MGRLPELVQWKGERAGMHPDPLDENGLYAPPVLGATSVLIRRGLALSSSTPLILIVIFSRFRGRLGGKLLRLCPSPGDLT